jgi:hypothetical protein
MRPPDWRHQPGTVGALCGVEAEFEGLVIHARESSDNPCSDLIEMKLHGFGVAERQNEGSAGSAFGADRAEQVG